MEITFLGSSNAFAAEGRYWSSFVVDQKYVFDAPPTLLPHLKRIGVPLPDIEVVFITHLHGDHFVGLPFLFLEYVYMTQRSKDLFIVGPEGIGEWMEDFANRCYPEITRQAGYRRRYIEAQPCTDQQAGPLTFKALPMNHVRDSMQALGYRVRVGAKTVAYTGDTMFCEEIITLAEGADVLVADSTYTDGSGPEHMGIDDIRVIREKISPGTTIIMTHRSGTPATDGMENVLVAQDLATFRFD